MVTNPDVKLSCLQCQQRKRKCDKRLPCQTCTRSGTACTPTVRPRLPRGRHAVQHGRDLRERVARLEEHLSTLASCSQASQPALPLVAGRDLEVAQVEIAGIKDVLDLLDLNEPDDDALMTLEPSQPESFDLLLYGDSSCMAFLDALKQPHDSLVAALLDIYLYRVDKVLKVVHASTLVDTLLGTAAKDDARKALTFAVLFAATNSLDNAECLQLFNTDRSERSKRYRLATEVYLSRAGLLTTSNLVVLQAYVIYLVSRRRHLTRTY